MSSCFRDSGVFAANFKQLIAFASRFLCCPMLDIDFFSCQKHITIDIISFGYFLCIGCYFEEVVVLAGTKTDIDLFYVSGTYATGVVFFA